MPPRSKPVKKNADAAADIQTSLSSGNFEKSKKDEIRQIITRKPNVKFKNDAQTNYAKLIEDYEITIACGPAGVGKSMIAIYEALKLIYSPDSPYEKIIIIKPVVEADEHLGFLPGTIKDKLEVYQYSSLNLVEKLIGKTATKLLCDGEIIVGMALAYLRGINIDNAVLILEEAQNTTPKQMLTLLTRIGENAKFIISGDEMQSDRYSDSSKCGLVDAIKRLKNMPEIGLHFFSSADVVRNPLISKIIDRYTDLDTPHMKK